MSEPEEADSGELGLDASLGPSDAELITAVRGGDLDAYGRLFERHADAARRLARQLVPPSDADDLVSEAFSKVLGVLQRGGGPDLAFRAYLLTSVRRLHVDRIRSTSRLTTTDDLTAYDPGVPFDDTAVSGFESSAAARAFASLPERWQQVLWHTEVEGQKPAEVALLLGMTPNSVSALAYRAREGLRQAFVTAHAQDHPEAEEACSWTRANLGGYVRRGLSKRDAGKVDAHLHDCRECTAIYLELVEVNADLGAVLAPLLLGTAGAGYLAASHVGAAVGVKGVLLVLLGRARDVAVANPIGAGVAGVAAAGVVATGVVVGVHATGGHAPVAPAAGHRPVPATSAPPAPTPTPAPRHHRPKPSPTPTARPTPAPTASPTPPAAVPPVATDGSVTVTAGDGSVRIDLARDVQGSTRQLIYTVGPAIAGTVTVRGAFAIYTPGSDATVVDSFRYTVTDGKGHRSHGTITVSVLGVSTFPIPSPSGSVSASPSPSDSASPSPSPTDSSS